MPDSICAVVVTHNRLSLLRDCIESLRRQTRPLDAVLVVDNGSRDGTAQWLSSQTGLHVITQENHGGAGGFHSGVAWALAASHDWLWLMDDDSAVKPNALQALVSNPLLSQTGIAACRVLNPDGTVQERVLGSVRSNDRVFRGITHGADIGPLVYSYPFLGLLVSRSKITAHGNINKDFFIQADDLEWTLRIAGKSGIAYEPSAELIHYDNVQFVEKRIGNMKARHLTTGSLWKDYYGFRNYIAVLRSNSKPYKITATKMLLRTLATRLFIGEFIYSAKVYLLAYHHGIMGVSGRRMLPSGRARCA